MQAESPYSVLILKISKKLYDICPETSGVQDTCHWEMCFSAVLLGQWSVFNLLKRHTVHGRLIYVHTAIKVSGHNQTTILCKFGILIRIW
jgi:hypothetical protein